MQTKFFLKVNSNQTSKSNLNPFFLESVLPKLRSLSLVDTVDVCLSKAMEPFHEFIETCDKWPKSFVIMSTNEASIAFSIQILFILFRLKFNFEFISFNLKNSFALFLAGEHETIHSMYEPNSSIHEFCSTISRTKSKIN